MLLKRMQNSAALCDSLNALIIKRMGREKVTLILRLVKKPGVKGLGHGFTLIFTDCHKICVIRVHY